MSLVKKENSRGLTIRCADFNIVMKKPTLLKKLRKLTLYPYSGMNYEITSLESLSKKRPVKCEALLAFYDGELVGWALLSRETSSFGFSNKPFKEGDGILFEIFIEDAYRRKRIGTKLLQIARRKSNGDKLCVAPWDFGSTRFYEKFKNYNYTRL